MLGYLEKQIILDYHLRGEQAQFEVDHEDLKEKAQTMFGLELYYELGARIGPVQEAKQPELFAKLMGIQKKISEELDECCSKHNVKLEEMTQKNEDLQGQGTDTS